MIEVILDFVVIICLGVTIGFAVILNKKLTTLYESRSELEAFLSNLTSSMTKAEANIKDLKGAGESVFKTAQEQMVKGTALKDDLVFLLQRGEELAQQLENHIRSARDMNKRLESHTVDPSAFMAPANQEGLMEEVEPEPELIRALKGVR